jgi:shikimate kinase
MGKLRLASESRALASKRARSSISDHRMSLGLTEHKKEDRQERLARIREALGPRSIVLIGLMGAGKTAVGRRLANRLDLPFIDADSEIEMAAGTSISEIFDEQGEAYFRQGERKVIARLLEGGPQVLATGGGAYMNADTRANIKARGLSVWLRAELRVLLKRVQRRDNRPLLACGDPETVMKKLMTERYPIYEEADVIVESRDVPHDVIVGAVIDALAAKLGCEANAPQEAKARQEAKAHQEQSRKKVQ